MKKSLIFVLFFIFFQFVFADKIDDAKAIEDSFGMLAPLQAEIQDIIERQHRINQIFPIIVVVVFVLGLIIIRQLYTTYNTNKQLEKTNIELHEAIVILQRLSKTDPLTELSNRRDMIEKMENEQNRFARSGKVFSIIMTDIDDFKEVNDKFGHDGGDFILKSLAQLMRYSIREQDTVGRWGGEEFLLLLPETDIDGAKSLAEKIRKNISVTPFVFADLEISVTMTFGIASYNKTMRIDDCIKKSDEALYHGKQKGKNCVFISSPEEPSFVITGKKLRKDDVDNEI